MKPALRGTVISVRSTLSDTRLRVTAQIRTEEGLTVEASLPDREVSAILPRSILLGRGAVASPSLLGTIEPILARMTEGRMVRIWDYKERRFFSFQSWKSVRFAEESRAIST